MPQGVCVVQVIQGLEAVGFFLSFFFFLLFLQSSHLPLAGSILCLFFFEQLDSACYLVGSQYLLLNLYGFFFNLRYKLRGYTMN